MTWRAFGWRSRVELPCLVTAVCDGLVITSIKFGFLVVGGRGVMAKLRGRDDWRGVEDDEAQTLGDPGQSNGKILSKVSPTEW